MTNPTFPWPMDMPVEEIINGSHTGTEWADIILYLAERVKIAEGERDTLRKCVEGYECEQYGFFR